MTSGGEGRRTLCTHAERGHPSIAFYATLFPHSLASFAAQGKQQDSTPIFPRSFPKSVRDFSRRVVVSVGLERVASISKSREDHLVFEKTTSFTRRPTRFREYYLVLEKTTLFSRRPLCSRKGHLVLEKTTSFLRRPPPSFREDHHLVFEKITI